MTIHHDKMAYGKLASLREDFSEERLEAMAKLLSEGAGEKAEDAEGTAERSAAAGAAERSAAAGAASEKDDIKKRNAEKSK